MTHLIASDKFTTVLDDFGPGWYAIASSRELKDGKLLPLTRFDSKLVAFRSGQGVAVFFDRCPHRGVQLSAGSLENGQLVCAFHGFHFDTQGQCTHIPAHGPEGVVPKGMKCQSLPAREAHGFLFVWWGEVPATLPPIDWFHDELQDCDGPYERFHDCETGLSRNIENQLDMGHVPFVHRKSIGRFVKSPRMEVECTVTGNRLRMFRKGGGEFYIELRLPNLWIIRTRPKNWGVLAFAPVTRTRTRIYTRHYQGSFKVPVLKQLLGWVMAWSNIRILQEDIRVIQQHDTPVSPPLDGTELLVPFDLPIIEYRRLREQWQRKRDD